MFHGDRVLPLIWCFEGDFSGVRLFVSSLVLVALGLVAVALFGCFVFPLFFLCCF